MIRTIIVIGLLLLFGGIFFQWRTQIVAKLKGWRTIIWNAIIGVVPVFGVVAQQLQGFDFTPYMTPLNAIIAGAVISAVGIWLRMVTDSPVGDKGE